MRPNPSRHLQGPQDRYDRHGHRHVVLPREAPRLLRRRWPRSFTNDADLADIIRSLRIHGQNNEDKYDNQRIGMTGRMDTIQAAVLIEKLKVFEDEIAARNTIPPIATMPRSPTSPMCHGSRRASSRSGAVHDPTARARPGGRRRLAKGARCADRHLLSAPRCTSRPPTATIPSPATDWTARLRPPCRRGHQLAHASLSRAPLQDRIVESVRAALN